MKSKNEKKRIWRLQARESSEYTREPDDDGWDCGDKNIELSCEAMHFTDEKTVGGFDFHCIDDWDESFPKPNFDIHKPPKKVYVVISRYTSGSTFGHTSGKFCVEGIFTRQSQAESFEKNNQETFKKKHSDYFGGFQYSQIESLPLFVD